MHSANAQACAHPCSPAELPSTGLQAGRTSIAPAHWHTRTQVPAGLMQSACAQACALPGPSCASPCV
eukprot:5706239-Alexandrium_andersonii.AAC.1